MMTNDNDSAIDGSPRFGSDAHGQAALLLVESLIHGLCEHSIISADQATEIAQTAVDIQLERAEASDDPDSPMWHSHALLLDIASSFMIDACGSPPHLSS